MALSLLRAAAPLLSSSPAAAAWNARPTTATMTTRTTQLLPLAPGRSLPSLGSRHSLGVVCMAHPRRVARVAKQLEREIGMLLLTDPALRAAVSPPARERAREGSLAGIASVSEVELTGNLQLARVYVSVYADAEDRGPAMRALERLQPYVRRRVASAMRLRSVPEIRFLADDSVEAGEQVEAALELARLRAAGLAELPAVVPSTRMGGAAAEEEVWRPRSSFPEFGAGASAAFDEEDEGEDPEGEESEDEEEGDESDDEDDDEDDDGFLDLGPSSDRSSPSAAASSSSSAPAAAAPAPRARASVAAASSPSPSQQQQDSFFGFEPPPVEGFWPGGDVPGRRSAPLLGEVGSGGLTQRASIGAFGREKALEEDLGDGVLGPDGIVRLAPGSGGGGPKKPPGGGGKPRQRPQRRR